MYSYAQYYIAIILNYSSKLQKAQHNLLIYNINFKVYLLG
jgi:hypothetical protein